MNEYFNHRFASNSDLKKIVARHEQRPELANLQQIFDFGTAFHSSILEPHKVQWETFSEEDQQVLKMMRNTFWKDELCRNIISVYDFRREHEFYRYGRFGLKGVRCKCDGESRALGTILELKGLKVATHKSFIDSLVHLDYDMGAAFYINVVTGAVNYKHKLIVGISKEYEDRLFKVLIDREHQLYKNGMEKIKKAVSIWRAWGME